MKGFVYLIINDNICKGYVGSCIDMERRMKKHKRDKSCMSREIICNPYTHEILEEIDFEELEELTIVEQKWIDLYKPYLVNKRRAYITKEERKEYKKARYDYNREAILAKRKTYHYANRETILAQKKANYNANRDARLAKQKAYNVANRDAISIKRKARYAKKKLLSTAILNA
jgi:hypothetical protein